MMDVKDFIEDYKSGNYQKPENCFKLPVEGWDEQNQHKAKRVVELCRVSILTGLSDDDLVDIIYSYIKREQTNAFARGLVLGYLAFGHKQEAYRAREIGEKISAFDSLALYIGIQSKLGSDVLSRFIKAGIEND